MASLRTKGIADHWFFVRYHDLPRRRGQTRIRGPHLRLRLELRNVRSRSHVDDLREWLPEAAIHPSAYRPEVTRYGGPGALRSIEEIFCLDSELVVAILLGGAGRIGASVLAIDALLTAFGLTPRERWAFYRHVARCGFPPGDDAALDAIYAPKRESFLTLLRPDRRRPTADFLVPWKEGLAEPAGRLRALARKGGLTQPMRHILESLVHMHCNRLGLSAEQERGVKWCLGRAAEELG